MAPADFLYSRTRADWDSQLAQGMSGVYHLSIWQVLRRVRARKYERIEIPEPLAVRLLPQLVLLALVVRWSNITRGNKTQLLTYAIENLDPIQKFKAQTKLPYALSALILRTCWRIIFRDLTKIAFGTTGAYETYELALGRNWRRVCERSKMKVFPALPAARKIPETKDPQTVCFLGTFEDRKGINELMTAWPEVSQTFPEARLTIMGKGPLAPSVQQFVDEFDSATLISDPPREAIRRVLEKSSCLVLLSKRTSTWREQVGLPIVEALEYGCEIVTTDETGIADWLQEHNHIVISDITDSQTVSMGIGQALQRRNRAKEILSSLPHTDSRLDADSWLFATGQ